MENEIDTTKLVAVKYKDSMILKHLPRDMSNFAESNLKISSLSHNTHAKIYKERIERISKDLKSIIHFYQIWNDLQKYWAYLLPIFAC